MKYKNKRSCAMLMATVSSLFLVQVASAAWQSVSGIPGSVGLPRNTFGCGNGLCSQISIPKSTVGYDLSYDVKFGSNFDWSRGGKVPGLTGDISLTGCNTGSGWSYRVMWRQDGLIIPYIYHKDRPTNCGHAFGVINTGNKYFTKGQWTNIRIRVKMNSGSNNDGVAILWVNGVQYFKNTTIKYATSSSERNVSKVMAHCYRGGSDSTWSSPTTGSVYFQNVKVNKL